MPTDNQKGLDSGKSALIKMKLGIFPLTIKRGSIQREKRTHIDEIGHFPTHNQRVLDSGGGLESSRTDQDEIGNFPTHNQRGLDSGECLNLPALILMKLGIFPLTIKRGSIPGKAHGSI